MKEDGQENSGRELGCLRY